MPVADFAHGVKTPFFAMVNHTNDGARSKLASEATSTVSTDKTGAAQTAQTDSGNSFWDDLLDVANPLQHLPVVGTVYRAVTGDKIGAVEKVAGDALYGGPVGLASSLADVAFEKITGKDFGDTVMGFFGLGKGDDATALAANTPKPARSIVADTKTSTPMPLVAATAAPIQLSRLATPTPASAPAAKAVQPSAQASAQTPVNISPQTDVLLSALARNGVTGQMQAQALDAYRRTVNMNAAAIAAN